MSPGLNFSDNVENSLRLRLKAAPVRGIFCNAGMFLHMPGRGLIYMIRSRVFG